MEFPLFVCNNCNFADKDNYILLKGHKIKPYNNPNKLNIKKEEYKTSSIDDNNSSSTNQLEIIEYPYNLDFNEEDDSLELNLRAAKMQLEKNLGMIHDDMSNKSSQNILEEGNNCDGRNFKSTTLNSSSLIVNNEDNISQNKILLKKLYSNYNNIKNEENKKNKNLIKKNGNKKVKGKKLKKLKKYNSNTKTPCSINNENNNLNSDKIIGIKVNYPCPDKEIDKFSIEEPRVLKSAKIRIKNINGIILKENQNSDNKINYLNPQKSGIINSENASKNRKTIIGESEKNIKEKNYKLSTDKIYSKFRDRLFNDKTNYMKNNPLRDNNKKRIINKDIYRNKTAYRFNFGNRTINTSAQTTNSNPLNTYNDNYRKLLLNRINKTSFHYTKTLSNYSMSNYRYSNLVHFKKKNIISNLFMSKTYMNPFIKEKKNLLYDFRATTLKNSKSRQNKK